MTAPEIGSLEGLETDGGLVRLQVKRLIAALEQGWSPQCESRPAEIGEWGVLKAGAANGGVFRENENKALPADVAPYVNYEITPGDLLVSRANTRELVGSVCFVRATRPRLLLCDKLFRISPLPQVDARYLAYALAAAEVRRYIESEVTGASDSMLNLSQETVRAIRVPMPSDRSRQSAIADYLDAETSLVDRMLAAKRRIVALLEERIDAEVLGQVEQSPLVAQRKSAELLPVRRLLLKENRVAALDGQMITAFRDGQVTARSLRRAEGFTEAWTEGSRLQGVLRNDVVVHGLDGFAGAIGASEADGVCSPVYHVCSVADGGDAEFYGRMLRLLATTGYLGNFATSTRERAVDFRNWDLFGSIPIPVIDPVLQRRIGDRIRALRPLRKLINASEQLVLERRRALITAAVTGQLEIPGAEA